MAADTMLDLRPRPDMQADAQAEALAETAISAEQAILGCAIYEPSCVDTIDDLTAEHFFEPTHGRIWSVLRSLAAAGRAGDPVLLYGRMQSDPGLESLGGIRYLADLVDRAPPAAWAADYAALVVEHATRRALIDLTGETNAALKGGAEAADALDGLERGCAEIGRVGMAGAPAQPIGLTAMDNLETALAGGFRGVEVGLRAIDRVTGGIKREDVWIIGGRSSMGKSIVGLSLARGIAQQGHGVIMFSLEMPAREVQARLMADLAHQEYAGVRNVRYSDILRGQLEPEQIDRAADAARRLASLPMTVTDVGGLTIDDIRRQALRQVRAWERAGVAPGAVLIDHLGLVRPMRQSASKAADTSDTVNELKTVAKRLGCPLIALAQVNRNPEGRSDKRPSMADLNWSGSIEQIADFVMLLYRQSYYDARSSDPDDVARADLNAHDIDLLIQKNRSGPICGVKAWIDVACNALRDALADRRPGE